MTFLKKKMTPSSPTHPHTHILTLPPPPPPLPPPKWTPEPTHDFCGRKKQQHLRCTAAGHTGPGRGLWQDRWCQSGSWWWSRAGMLRSQRYPFAGKSRTGCLEAENLKHKREREINCDHQVSGQKDGTTQANMDKKQRLQKQKLLKQTRLVSWFGLAVRR